MRLKKVGFAQTRLATLLRTNALLRAITKPANAKLRRVISSPMRGGRGGGARKDGGARLRFAFRPHRLGRRADAAINRAHANRGLLAGRFQLLATIALLVIARGRRVDVGHFAFARSQIRWRLALSLAVFGLVFAVGFHRHLRARRLARTWGASRSAWRSSGSCARFPRARAKIGSDRRTPSWAWLLSGARRF